MELKELLNLYAQQRADMFDRMVRHQLFAVMARVDEKWYCLHHDAQIEGKDREGTFQTKIDATLCAQLLISYPEVEEAVVIEMVATERLTTEKVTKG